VLCGYTPPLRVAPPWMLTLTDLALNSDDAVVGPNDTAWNATDPAAFEQSLGRKRDQLLEEFVATSVEAGREWQNGGGGGDGWWA